MFLLSIWLPGSWCSEVTLKARAKRPACCQAEKAPVAGRRSFLGALGLAEGPKSSVCAKPSFLATAGHVATACPVLLGKLPLRRGGARPRPSHACWWVTARSRPVRYAPLLEPPCLRDGSLAQGHIHGKRQCWDPKEAPGTCLTGFRALLRLGECLVCNP